MHGKVPPQQKRKPSLLSGPSLISKRWTTKNTQHSMICTKFLKSQDWPKQVGFDGQFKRCSNSNWNASFSSGKEKIIQIDTRFETKISHGWNFVVFNVSTGNTSQVTSNVAMEVLLFQYETHQQMSTHGGLSITILDYCCRGYTFDTTGQLIVI